MRCRNRAYPDGQVGYPRAGIPLGQPDRVRSSRMGPRSAIALEAQGWRGFFAAPAVFARADFHSLRRIPMTTVFP